MNLHQNIAKSTIEFAYLQKKLEVHEELQTNWVLCDILDFEEELLSDPKECAEHIMLVDLGRNDIGRVCEYGTKFGPPFFQDGFRELC